MTNMLIQGVYPRQVNGRNGTFTLMEVDLNGQKYVAKKEVADLAARMIGQPVEAVTRVEQRGQYTNYYVDDLRPAGYGGTATVAQPPASVSPSDRDRQIWRQTATKVAATLSEGGAGGFWENVDMLLRFYETGVHPVTPVPSPDYGLPAFSGPDQYTPDENIPF